MTPKLTEQMDRVRKRLAEVAKDLDDLVEDDGSRRSELIEEEHRLQARLQHLADDSVSENEGAAERLVDEEGANADEIPKLPDESEESDDPEEESDQV